MWKRKKAWVGVCVCVCVVSRKSTDARTDPVRLVGVGEACVPCHAAQHGGRPCRAFGAMDTLHKTACGVCGGAGVTRRCCHPLCARRRSALWRLRHVALCDTKKYHPDDGRHPKQRESFLIVKNNTGRARGKTRTHALPVDRCSRNQKKEKSGATKGNDRTKVAQRGNNTTTSKPEEDFCCGVAMMGIPCAVMVLL